MLFKLLEVLGNIAIDRNAEGGIVQCFLKNLWYEKAYSVIMAGFSLILIIYKPHAIHLYHDRSE